MFLECDVDVYCSHHRSVAHSVWVFLHLPRQNVCQGMYRQHKRAPVLAETVLLCCWCKVCLPDSATDCVVVVKPWGSLGFLHGQAW